MRAWQPHSLALFFSLFVLLGCNDDGGAGQNDPDTGHDVAIDVAVDVGDVGPDLPPVDPVQYADRSLSEQVDAITTGRLSCADLTAEYLSRIDERDDGPGGLGAIITTIDDSREKATAIDGSPGGLLAGAVIVVKDNIDTADLPTTAGSLAMMGNIPTFDAHLVMRLQQEGALVLGKANLSEWANFRGSPSVSGWSSFGGQTYNAADGVSSPCGSSSGPAVAVAAGMASGAVGTETNGSIICPASVNGVVGFKPTVGLISRAGLVPISHTFDTAGPLTRTVSDAALMVAAMMGADPADAATANIPSTLTPDAIHQALADADLDGVRFGVTTTGPEILVEPFAAAMADMEAAGATFVEVSLPPPLFYAQPSFTVLFFEFKVGLNDYLASHPAEGQPRTLSELITFNEENADVVMPYFGQELFLEAEATDGLENQTYLEARERSQRVIGPEGIMAVMEDNDLDALVSPSATPAFPIDYESGDMFGFVASGPAAVAGYPHITVPMGRIDGLPVGISFYGGPWQDAEILALGHAFEQVSTPD